MRHEIIALAGVPGLGAGLHALLRWAHLPAWAILLIVLAVVVLVRVAIHYRRRNRRR